MIGTLLSLLAFVATLTAGKKSIGHGIGTLFLFGYIYGIARANFPDGRSHFIFDMALLGLYLAVFVFGRGQASPREARLRPWFWALVVWPILTIPLSILTPSQHVLIQLVGLRVAVLMLPLMLLGARLDGVELLKVGKWLLGLNGLAFGVALLEMALGVERFFPKNQVTEIIYISADIGAERAFRIPATFSSAHAYAGTMLVSLPFVAWMWMQKKVKPLTAFGVLLMTAAGLFISGARSPVAQLAMAGALFLFSGKVQARTRMAAVAAVLVLGVAVASNERLQRVLSLQDTEAVEERLSGSLNHNLLEVMFDYPLGAGLGGAAGTSVPFFLSHLAAPQIGLENEFGRIALEQGILGLALWFVFLFWFLLTPTGSSPLGSEAARLGRSLVVVLWATAFIGTGLLASIPGSALFMLLMGMVAPGGRAAVATLRSGVPRRVRPAVRRPLGPLPSAPRLPRLTVRK